MDPVIAPEIETELEAEVIHGPIAYRGNYKLPHGFEWLSDLKTHAIRVKDDRVFLVKREIDATARPKCGEGAPHTVEPSMRYVLTEETSCF